MIALPAPPLQPCWYEIDGTEPPLRCAPLHGTEKTDVCILGGGLAGLATALSLAERRVDTVLLEGRTLGAGASGRNGGIVSGGFALPTSTLEKRLGLPHAQELHRTSRDALTLIRDRIRRERMAVPITEGLVIASFFDEPEKIRVEIAGLNQHYEMRLELRSRDWMRAAFSSHCYSAGVFDPDGFHLDPLALTRAYGRAAQCRGTRLYEQSQAIRLAPQAGGWIIRTAHGEVGASHVVIATGAYGDPLLPEIRRALVPIATFIIVTGPLGDRLEEAIRHPFAVYDDRFATGYYRPVPGRRLLWGGRIALSEQLPRLGETMRRDLATVYPELADVPLASAWGGSMAFTRHKMPLIRHLGRGLWVATGFGGHGLNTTTMAGELIAHAIATGDGQPLDSFLPFKPVRTYGLFGRWGANLIYRSHVAHDRWRIRRHRRLRA
jgi:gamma-glutamylputrescine oxidase